MKFYQSFEWKYDIKEAEYRFAIVDIALELGCSLAVFENSENDRKDTVKFAIKYPSDDVLEKFKQRITHRMMLFNWAKMSAYDFRDYYFVFTQNTFISSPTQRFQQFLKEEFDLPMFLLGIRIVILFPYQNHTEEFNVKGVLLDDNHQLLPESLWGHNPNIEQMKQVISNLVGYSEDVTYFYSKNRWDAKIDNEDENLLICTFFDELDEIKPCEFVFDSYSQLVKRIVQDIANICGTMILEGDIQKPIIFKPQNP